MVYNISREVCLLPTTQTNATMEEDLTVKNYKSILLNYQNNPTFFTYFHQIKFTNTQPTHLLSSRLIRVVLSQYPNHHPCTV